MPGTDNQQQRGKTSSVRPPWSCGTEHCFLQPFSEEAVEHQRNRTVLNLLPWASYSR